MKSFDNEKIIFDDKILPQKMLHGQSYLDYDNFIGLKIYFTYKNISDYFVINSIKRVNDKVFLEINYNNYNFEINSLSFRKKSFYQYIKRYTFKYKIGTIIKDHKILDRDCIYETYRTSSHYTRKYYCECIKCGNKSWKTEHTLGGVCVCTFCGESHKNIVQGINDIPTTDPWMVDYFQGGYDEAKNFSCCSSKRIFPKCPFCGEIKKTDIKISNIYTKKGISCICNDNMSYPNKLMYNILRIKQIDFLSEFSPEWIKPKRYDFYIPKYSIIIEMDGGWHYIDNVLSKQSKQKSKLIDEYKNIKAKEHGISIYRINCSQSEFDYISNSIFDNKISEILNITKDEIIEADKMSHKNIVKEICNYKKRHNNLTSVSIANVFKLSKDTIQKYIKIGVRYGWCEPFKYFTPFNYIILKKDGVDIGIFHKREILQKYIKETYNIEINEYLIKKYLKTGEIYLGLQFIKCTREQSSYFSQSDNIFECALFQNDLIEKLSVL